MIGGKVQREAHVLIELVSPLVTSVTYVPLINFQKQVKTQKSPVVWFHVGYKQRSHGGKFFACLFGPSIHPNLLPVQIVSLYTMSPDVLLCSQHNYYRH